MEIAIWGNLLPAIMENDMEKNMGHEMEVAVISEV